VILRARLLAPSRFARASALSGLEELARTSSPAVRAQAIVACARDVDAANGRLDPIEIDRVRAAIRQWPNEPERDAALARLDASVALAVLAKSAELGSTAIETNEIDRAVALVLSAAPEAQSLVHRARALVSGGAGAGTDSIANASMGMRLSALGLDVVAAMGRAEEADAQAAMARAADVLSPTSQVPLVLWNGARLALRSKNDRTRKAASELIAEALSRSTSAPPFGFVTLAHELDRGGFHAVSALALKEGLRLKEQNAALALAEAQRKLAYAALARGDRMRALELLRESKDLFARA
jgi:hypothetical protein